MVEHVTTATKATSPVSRFLTRKEAGLLLYRQRDGWRRVVGERPFHTRSNGRVQYEEHCTKRCASKLPT
ncbi:hypothetical protein LZ31DRAFT_552891 [Colletotrichum somersetense]|nr:hypothetical protein LZ31DRAFT_552891 [Colletotrichum somersetense]